MLIKKSISVAAIGLSLAAGMMSAQASTITNGNGTKNWTGFDWDSNGTAYTTGFADVAGTNFTLTAFAWAANLKDGATNIFSPFLDNNADGVSALPGLAYEYTLVVSLNETVTGCSGPACTFGILSGTYDIYYDTTADANALAGSLGTGFLDGTKILSGTISTQAGGTFTVSGSGGTGVTTIFGANTFTDNAFINPNQTATTATTTLQLGDAFTNAYVSPGGFNGVAFVPGPGNIVFQADANQSFSAVPEPESLALFGIALLASVATTRRRITDKK